ncbi:MAG TPA: tautomerase family protein [Myxococcales bacterium]|nr:tautomerase family protein [Myxococcales bacterium]
MPFVRIDLRKGRTAEQRRAISAAVHEAMVETIQIPPLDRFQIIAEHDEESFVYDPSYLDISRSDGLVFIQICISLGRTVEIKKALFAAIAARVSATGVRPEDVFIGVIETERPNWSFGNGIATYAVK